MKVGDTIYINGSYETKILKLVGNRVTVKYGCTGRYTSSTSDVKKVGDKLILESEIFKF